MSITRGAIAHGADALPETSVIQIVEVTQGATTFTEGADYIRAGNTVDWAPLGDEPAPSSSYNVTFRYRDSVAPAAFTATRLATHSDRAAFANPAG